MPTIIHRSLTATLTLTLVLAAGTSRADDRIGLLVTADQLEDRIEDRLLRILDVRSADDYEAGHIPGAIRVDVNAWKNLALSDGGLTDRDAWSEQVGRLGINNQTRVVVYGGDPTSATRVWWTLKYVGVNEAGVLDGGFDAWKQADLPVETADVDVETVEFTVRFQPDRVAELDDIRSVLRTGTGTATIIDTRSLAEHTGESGGTERKGHIPGALHQEWSDFVTDEGRFKPTAEIRRLLQQRGLTPDSPAITHCQTGGRASLTAFVMELAGYGPVKNYYCGFSEWSAAEDTPVENPE
jgi:thiosulfate/3-mercaptopyruvate sulfurtransferase